MEQIDYKLDGFEGPLDLLLHLIEKNKFSIFDIPIVEITNQYLEAVGKMQREDLDGMSDFLVMAAELLEIKSKMLLPPEKTETEEESDPRTELVQQLLEYKMFKYAAEELKDLEIGAADAIYRKPDIPAEVKENRQEVDPAELVAESGTTIIRLNEIFQALIRRERDRVDPVRSRFGTITKDEVRLEDRITEIREEVRGLQSISFRTLLGTHRTKMNLIVSFMAILELMKGGAITIRQDHMFGEILIDSLE